MVSNVVWTASGDIGASIQDNVALDARYGDVHTSRCREFFFEEVYIVSFACLDTPGRFSIIFFAHPQTSGFTTIRGRSPHPARDIPSRISRIEKTITVYLPTKKKHKGRAGK
jgi:hypothetical protein